MSVLSGPGALCRPTSGSPWRSYSGLQIASQTGQLRQSTTGPQTAPGQIFSTEPQTGPGQVYPSMSAPGPSWGPQTSWTLTDRAPSRGRSPVKRKRKHRRRHRSSSSRGSSSSRSGSGDGRKRHRHSRRRTVLREGQAPILSLLTAMKESLDTLHAALRDPEPREPDILPSAQGPATSPVPASPTVGRDPELEPHGGGLSVPSGPGALCWPADGVPSRSHSSGTRYQMAPGSDKGPATSPIPLAPTVGRDSELELYASESPSEGESARSWRSEGPPRETEHGLPPPLVSPVSEGESGDLTDIEYVRLLAIVYGVLGIVDTPPEVPASRCDWQRIGTSGTGALPRSPPQLHVDGELYDRYARLANRHWSAYPRDLDRLLRVGQVQYEALIRPPPIPQGAWDRLVMRGQAKMTPAREGSAPAYKLSATCPSDREEELRGFDRVARFGLKLSALQLLLSEWLLRAPSPRDPAEMALVHRALALITRRSHDQFSRMALRATYFRRRNALPLLGLSCIAAGELMATPLLGPDLFGGCFRSCGRTGHDKERGPSQNVGSLDNHVLPPSRRETARTRERFPSS